MKSAGKLTPLLITAFSLFLVFGALFTALAETGFSAIGQTKIPEEVVSGLPSATALIIPTKQEQPTSAQKTSTLVAATPIEKTSQPDQTTTASPTATQKADSISCTKPSGWLEYTVRSGDTLFAISLIFQTDVTRLKQANCLTSNQIITGQVLWVPNNTTLTPTKTPQSATATNTPKPTTESCYTLTLSHLGEGADPTASPTNSDGCPVNEYKAGEIISLIAEPDPGWEVSGWVGTIDDDSTEQTNQVKMPGMDHLAKPIYTELPPTCYLLSVSSGPNGGDPVPDKPNSAGCNDREYVEGEIITFTASPDSGYTVDTWTGTDGGTNVLTMKASPASVEVTYMAVCYTLTLGITAGSGSLPAASDSTQGCSAGTYIVGEIITITASPAEGSVVISWDTPLNYVTTEDPNVIKATMIAADSYVNVTYNP